ncbi:MAG: hypothetical protein V7K72_18735 [Nostoc sp.]
MLLGFEQKSGGERINTLLLWDTTNNFSYGVLKIGGYIACNESDRVL